MEVTLHNRSTEISLVHQALDAFASQHSLSVPRLNKLHLAIEEHLTNIIAYAYDPGQAGTIRVRFALAAPALSVEIEDDGHPYNPMEAPEVDTSLPLDKKPLGGLGVHLIRKNADELSYARREGRNILTLMSRVTPVGLTK